ncbi:putative porin [Aridibaculum aurantiacum]|uniref:putative porin n=1 Tax=Aridibaculum aurantiacum TaxID=2810307 RepID=UPI001A961743|nr:putative porin [Aridibaculum aurantiacum]
MLHLYLYFVQHLLFLYMKKGSIHYSILIILLLFIATGAEAQRGREVINEQTTTPVRRFDATGRPIPTATNARTDTLQRRDSNVDSITIYFRIFDSTRIHFLDSTVNNFYNRVPVPPHYVHLGNHGTAARSLLFNPNTRPGWDAGFHAYDIYRLKVEDTRFYQTTRPFTEMGYLLGSKTEQMINILHTQNIKPTFNMAFQYRFINSPGFFKSQNTSHNSFRINGHYQSNNKRYTAYGIFISNRFKASENGGVKYDSLLGDSRYDDRFLLPTRLGGDVQFRRDFLSTNISLGNIYKEDVFLYRHQYDLGQRDSLVVNDSTTIKLFYPRLRLEHTLRYGSFDYLFKDVPNQPNPTRDVDYQNIFGLTVGMNDSLKFNDRWREIRNDFSLVSFPEKNNLNQFLKAGITLQNLRATFDSTGDRFHNLFVHGEYRNRTRNQKWDLEAKGNFYINGLNAGDYLAEVRLKRVLNARLGFIQLGFMNVNRTPSFVFNEASSFPVTTTQNFDKENITRISAQLNNDRYGFNLSGNLYLVSNYSYFNGFLSAQQYSPLFNVLHLTAEKRFRWGKGLNLVSAIHLQQTAGNPPVNLPLIFTNHRFFYQGIYAKNMLLATGVELRYHTPFRGDGYSPFVGQFFYQDTMMLRNRPEVNVFFNFRIKTFNAFTRLENLQSLIPGGGGNYSKESQFVPHYYYPSLWVRIGIFWRFIN